MKPLYLPAAGIGLVLAAMISACGGGGSASSTSTTSTTAADATAATSASASTSTGTGTFKISSAIVAEGGSLPSDYTCDGTGSTLALTWANAPAATKEFAVMMTTVDAGGATKYNWVLYGVPGSKTSLAKDSYGVGTLGVGSDGPSATYQAPCSQGLGAKTYTYKVYALSASPSVSGTVTGSVLASAISGMTLGSAALNVTYNRSATATGLGANCLNVRNSIAASTTGNASVSCDSTYAYVGSGALATHAMMTGIVASNLQIPVEQNFFGASAWKIPLSPAIAAVTTSAVDGPIAVAINGVPIFNPCKQGGCANGDTKVLGELDACNGHAGRADDYHYHAAPTCMMAGKPAAYWDTHPVGWALDGFAIFGYNNADGTVATRDATCGGNTSAVSNAPSGFSYHVTDASPYVLSCFKGTPSPDLAGQGAKYIPMRQPPVTPFPVNNMTLTTDSTDGYQVLKFTSNQTFNTNETGTDNYATAAGTYNIRSKSVTGTALAALLALSQNSSKSACWSFQFSNSSNATTQPAVSYCR